MCVPFKIESSCITVNVCVSAVRVFNEIPYVGHLTCENSKWIPVSYDHPLAKPMKYEIQAIKFTSLCVTFGQPRKLL